MTHASDEAADAIKIATYNVNGVNGRLPRLLDWLRETSHTLLERGMMGDGIIDLHGFSAMIEAAGYGGPIEVEILNPAIWAMPLPELVPLIVERFERYVL